MIHDKCLFKVFELLKVVEDLVCQPILGRDGDNIGKVLSPHDVNLMKVRMKVVKLRKKEGTSLLLLRNTVLRIVPRTT